MTNEQFISLVIGSLPRAASDSLKFRTDGKIIICPTRKTTAAIKLLLEKALGIRLKSTNYEVTLSDTALPQLPFSDKTAGIVFHEFATRLPGKPEDIWSADMFDILCKTEETANIIADFLDDLAGGQVSVTGYFDPKEDEESGEVDHMTGFYYVDI